MANPITLKPHMSGDTWRGLTLTLSVNGAPMNLTGATVKMQMRKAPTASNAEYTWSTADGSISITNAAAGQLAVNKRVVSGTGSLHFDLQVTTADGDVRTMVRGTMNLIQDVTRG